MLKASVSMLFSRFAIAVGLLLCYSIPGWSAGLILASGSAQAGTTIPLNIYLSGTSTNTSPAGLQFTLTYSAADFSAVSIALGTVASGAGKGVSCNPASGQIICLVFGMNTTSMGDGVVAVANATVSSTATAPIPGGR